MNKKLEIDTLVRLDPPIQKVLDIHEKRDKTQQEVLKEILLDTYKNGENSQPDLDTLLNIMIPPVEFQKNGIEYIQYVSHQPGTREDIIALQKELDRKLIDRQAKDHGICPIREELHSQCFDEIL